MSENKKLLWTIIGIFSVSFFLVIGVIAHDRQIDKCIVDHLFDFHLDEEKVQEDLEADKFHKEVEERMERDNERRRREWVDDIRSWWRDADDYGSDRGTIGPPDRDK